jgi:hypothetical protein
MKKTMFPVAAPRLSPAPAMSACHANLFRVRTFFAGSKHRALGCLLSARLSKKDVFASTEENQHGF